MTQYFCIVHVMYDLGHRLESSEQLVEALCLLQYVLSNSPSNFHAKLLSLQIYNKLGCGWGAHKTYESLDIKHVQLDSLGYLHCAQLPVMGINTVAKPLYDATLRFFTTSYKESLEHLSKCYKYGSFSKLQEFMDFRDKLSNSLHYSLMSAEALLIELVCMSGTYGQNVASVLGMNIDPEAHNIPFDELEDNRDLSVIVRWDPRPDNEQSESTTESVPTQSDPQEVAKDSFKQDMHLMEVRSKLLQLIGVSATALCDPSANALPTLPLLLVSWTTLFQTIRPLNYKPVPDNFVSHLHKSRLHSFLAVPYETYFEDLTTLVIGLLSEVSPDLKMLGAQASSNIVEISGLLCKRLVQNNECSDPLWDRRDAQEVVVNCLEVIL